MAFALRFTAAGRRPPLAGLAVLFTLFTTAGPLAGQPLQLVELFGGFTSGLDRPLAVVAVPDGKYLAVNQRGYISAVRDGEVLPERYFDIINDVRCCGESGMLGIAVSPDYKSDRAVFVSYILDDELGPPYWMIIEELGSTPENPDVATKRREVMRFLQPDDRHNGGGLMFGPDGHLYLGVGDGTDGGSPRNQDLSEMLGAMIRINPFEGPPPSNQCGTGDGYSVPTDNPWVDDLGVCPEIWNYGLRNPWRFSFGPPGELEGLYIGDVGSAFFEEINLSRAPAGENFGWPCREGLTEEFPARVCVPRPGEMELDLADPIISDSHDPGDAVIGGFIYEGSNMPQWVGCYVYAMFPDRIRVTCYDSVLQVWERALGWDATVNPIRSLGLSHEGEILVVQGVGPPMVFELFAEVFSDGFESGDISSWTFN